MLQTLCNTGSYEEATRSAGLCIIIKQQEFPILSMVSKKNSYLKLYCCHPDYIQVVTLILNQSIWTKIGKGNFSGSLTNPTIDDM